MTEKPSFHQLWQRRQNSKPATPKQVDDVVPEFDYGPWGESELAGMHGFVEPAVDWDDIPVKETIIYEDQGGQNGR